MALYHPDLSMLLGSIERLDDDVRSRKDQLRAGALEAI